eukprot:1767707-Amphidinium_carterae.1
MKADGTEAESLLIQGPAAGPSTQLLGGGNLRLLFMTESLDGEGSKHKWSGRSAMPSTIRARHTPHPAPDAGGVIDNDFGGSASTRSSRKCCFSRKFKWPTR